VDGSPCQPVGDELWPSPAYPPPSSPAHAFGVPEPQPRRGRHRLRHRQPMPAARILLRAAELEWSGCRHRLCFDRKRWQSRPSGNRTGPPNVTAPQRPGAVAVFSEVEHGDASEAVLPASKLAVRPDRRWHRSVGELRLIGHNQPGGRTCRGSCRRLSSSRMCAPSPNGCCCVRLAIIPLRQGCVEKHKGIDFCFGDGLISATGRGRDWRPQPRW
jgi:hypothetical protein